MSAATYADQVYEHILDQIFQRELRPGDVLDRKQIAEQLEISLIPISDAVHRLTYEGFLTTRRRQGTFVSTPSVEDIRGQILLREALECQSARLYCGDRIRNARKQLLPLAKVADEAAASKKQVWSEDFAFHQALVGLTGADALVKCFERVVSLSMFYQTAMISPLRSVTYDRHVRLLNELCELSPDAAEARIRKHIRSGKNAVFDDQ